MRTLLTTALLLPLLTVAIRDSSHRLPPPRTLPSFPLSVGRAPAVGRTASVLLMALNRSAESFGVSSPEQGVRFDIDGDGVREQVAWPEIGADIAFLALDEDGDGLVTSGKELIGPAMVPAAKNAANVLSELRRAAGLPPVGSLAAGDPLYERLLVWIDRNRNGVGEPRELRPARELFTAIGMGYTSLHLADAKGNRVDFEGWTQIRTGGPDQPHAFLLPAEERIRQRPSFVTSLVVRN
jgi:hypothetical protein